MKNIIKLLLLVIASFSLVMVGCKKDAVVNNIFTFDGIDYVITKGYIDNWGATTHSPSTYKYEIVLTTSDISFDETFLNYTGIGSYMKISLYSTDISTLTSGTYTFDAFSTKDSLTIDTSSVVGINHDITFDADTGFYHLKTGVVEVSNNGGIYNLNVQLYTFDDKEINGYYSGLLNEHSFTKK